MRRSSHVQPSFLVCSDGWSPGNLRVNPPNSLRKSAAFASTGNPAVSSIPAYLDTFSLRESDQPAAFNARSVSLASICRTTLLTLRYRLLADAIKVGGSPDEELAAGDGDRRERVGAV